jgi:hypothetical protein
MRRNLLTFTSILATAAVAVLPLSACIGSASTPRAAVATLLPSAPATTSLPSAPAAMVPARDELQSVLADAMLTDPAALCEWDVWGEAQQTLYVWAVCESASGAAVSAPAVVHLDVDGHVAGASLPGDGTGYGHDVRRLFPPGVQKRIFAHEYDAVAAMERIAERRRNGGFGIYLVDEVITAQEMLQADVDKLGLEETPIISLDDIVAYDATTHEIQLADSAYQRVGGLEVPVQGLPFVVCAGSERIYGGAFWVSYSSLGYEGIVIDIFPAIANDPGQTLRIQLGYPESLELFVGEDPRSHPRILESLEAVGKLH